MEEQAERRVVPADEQTAYRGALTDIGVGVAAALTADGVKDGAKLLGKQVIDAVKSKKADRD